ncbi:hypothetical protein JB92DRAFT_2834163 [Gautieria morchelliformis]|nr:hypothetical protein JB92DRAFT_2834163 [Gautieria morchelliformis]
MFYLSGQVIPALFLLGSPKRLVCVPRFSVQYAPRTVLYLSLRLTLPPSTHAAPNPTLRRNEECPTSRHRRENSYPVLRALRPRYMDRLPTRPPPFPLTAQNLAPPSYDTGGGAVLSLGVGVGVYVCGGRRVPI